MDYEEKLRLAKEALDSGSYDKETIEYIFPELKESEDERIRKKVIATIHLYYGEPLEDEAKEMIAWLEKQDGQKPAGKVEPKFKVGDTVIVKPMSCHGKVFKGEPFMIIDIIEDNYVSDDGKTYSISLQDGWELVEQKPAYTKEYDFHGIKFIPKFAKGDIIKDKKCGEVSTIEDFSYDTGLYTYTYGQFPITIQEQYELVEQKQEWGKEDEKIIRRIDSLLYSQCKIHGSEYEEIHNWLKSLRPQNHWKPSDEQIEALEHFVRSIGESGYSSPYDNNTKLLYLLLEQLKKLREE